MKMADEEQGPAAEHKRMCRLMQRGDQVTTQNNGENEGQDRLLDLLRLLWGG